MKGSSSLPDTEIVAHIRNGRRMEEMISLLYRQHWGTLSAYTLANSGSRQDAEDIFQEVVVDFIAVVQAGKFREESGIRTFLYAMNRHAWLNELKRRGRAIAREEKYEKAKPQVEDDASAWMADREARAEVARLLGSLGETCRKILVLFYYEDLPMKKILEATDYENEQVVRNKKYKCLKELEQLINDRPHLRQTLKNLLNE